MAGYPNEGSDPRFDLFGILRWLQNKFSYQFTGPESTLGLAMILLRPFALVLNIPWTKKRVLHIRAGGRVDDWGVVRPTFAAKAVATPLPHVKWDLGRIEK